jgi:four helix bundle protein
VLNIAEGCDRGSDKDFAHFLNISHTSLNEVVACIDVALDEGYIIEKENFDLINKAAALANQLTAFRSNILKNPKK